MSWEQRNADFCNAQTDAQMAYIEAEREVDRLEAENAKLRELVRDMVLNMGGCALHGNPLRLREFGNRAKELGVDDG